MEAGWLEGIAKAIVGGDDRDGHLIDHDGDIGAGIKRGQVGQIAFLRLDHRAILIVAAVGADAMRQHGLFAVGAVLDLHRLDVQVAAPLTLPCVGRSSLRNRHD